MIVARSTTLFVGIDLTPELRHCCPRRDSIKSHTTMPRVYLSLLKPDPLSTLLFSNIPPDITYSAEIQTFLYNHRTTPRVPDIRLFSDRIGASNSTCP